jgi:exopolyphosphatase / guanosine-5'-triphosphate,3'-diphosphate pyrophosphatase
MRRFRRAGPSRHGGGGRPPPWARETFAALDLGTNNCRLLVAEAVPGGGFKVVDGYSEIVRLGEGLAATGRLSAAAMQRTMGALGVCAAKLDKRRPVAVGCIATQACRQAENGPAFLARVAEELGLIFEVITPEDEARLAVLGCASLVDPDAEAALIVDIGGGSTELSWVDAKAARAGVPPILAWSSAPIGVVTLAESAAEPAPGTPASEAWYADMVARLAGRIAAIETPAHVRQAFAQGRGHIVGTSGTITSLAGVHLDLPRYQRSKVDGLWLAREDVAAATHKLRALSPRARARHPCIGPDRADLVVPGCAILEAVCAVWPVQRLRVADRGLREGVLMTLIARHHGVQS